MGDIVYSLPTVKALGGGIFYVDHFTRYWHKEPLGKKSALMMVELLETQEYIVEAGLYDGQPVTHDLDKFRDTAVRNIGHHFVNGFMNDISNTFFGGLFNDMHNKIFNDVNMHLPLSHWRAMGQQGRLDLSKPWLTGIEKKEAAPIVVCKTPRYSGKLDWMALQEYEDRCVFIGLETEWQAFRRSFFDIKFYQVKNLLEFAMVVAGAKLYVGNQSFGLALADGMMMPRVAQLWELNPNRLPPADNYQETLTRSFVEKYISS